MKRIAIVSMLGLALMASGAWAQAPEGQDPGAQQGQRRARQREGQGQGMRARGMPGMGDVEQAVTLTAEQKQQVQALQEKMREQMRTRMREQFGAGQAGGQRDPAAFQQQRELRQQLLEAARAGDDQKVEQLRQQINESGMTAQQRKLVNDYYDDVEKILTLEQKRQFQDWRKLQDSGVPATLLTNPQALKTALERVDLADLQKNRVEASFSRFETDTARMTDADAQARQARTIELAAEVVDVLKPSQKVLLSQATFGNRQRGGDREGRGGRGDRGGRAGGEGRGGDATPAPATQQ